MGTSFSIYLRDPIHPEPFRALVHDLGGCFYDEAKLEGTIQNGEARVWFDGVHPVDWDAETSYETGALQGEFLARRLGGPPGQVMFGRIGRASESALLCLQFFVEVTRRWLAVVVAMATRTLGADELLARRNEGKGLYRSWPGGVGWLYLARPFSKEWRDVLESQGGVVFGEDDTRRADCHARALERGFDLRRQLPLAHWTRAGGDLWVGTEREWDAVPDAQRAESMVWQQTSRALGTPPRFCLHLGIGRPTNLEGERLLVEFAAGCAERVPCVFSHDYEGPFTHEELAELARAGKPVFWS
jgi:hypothetical protein